MKRIVKALASIAIFGIVGYTIGSLLGDVITDFDPLRIYLSEFETETQKSVPIECGITSVTVEAREQPSPNSRFITHISEGSVICVGEVLISDSIAWGYLYQAEFVPSGWIRLENIVYTHTLPDTTGEYKLVKKQSGECLYDRLEIETISPELITINRQYTELTKVQLQQLDTLLSKTMNVELIPSVVWWVGDVDLEFAAPYLSIDLGGWNGKQTARVWDGCNLRYASEPSLVGVAVVRVQDGADYDFDTYLHERSHTLGAVHGLDAINYDEQPEENIEGPMDAYWWGDAGTFAYLDACYVFEAESQKHNICLAIADVLQS